MRAAARHRARRAARRPGPAPRSAAPTRARRPWPCGCLPGPGAPRPRPAPGRPPAGRGPRPERGYGGDSGSYPIDPLDPAYPVPAARYPDEPATGTYRRPAQEYGPAAGYPADPGPPAARPAASTGTPGRPATTTCPPAGDYRSGQSGSHRRDPGDFPGDPRGPRYGTDAAEAGYHDEDDHGGYHDAGYPDVPATGDYRTVQSGSHRRPAGGYPGDPSFHPYSGQTGNADYPGEAPADDSGAYPRRAGLWRGRRVG